MSTTLDALRHELGTGPYLYRCSGPDREEGAFLARSYWMVSALCLWDAATRRRSNWRGWPTHRTIRHPRGDDRSGRRIVSG